MSSEQYCIWWTSQRDCELIEERELFSETIPDYIRVEYRSRLGRNGRGRLWVHESLSANDIEWDASKPASRLAEERGGIVIHKEDSQHVFGLPGFLTDTKLNFINDVTE